MTKGRNPRVEELFRKYRDNFDLLDSLFKDKGTDRGFGEVRVKGEVFTRFAYFDQVTDLTLHSCELTAYPEHLTSLFPGGPFTQYSWTDKQETELRQIFNGLPINLSRFEQAACEAKGFWIEYLLAKKWDEYFKQSPRPSVSSINFSGALGDVLGTIVPAYSDKVIEISQREAFKKIEGAGRPIERQGAISDYFLGLFIDKYYVCSHFEKSECIICSREFYPQCDREWVNRVPPVFCQLCLQMGFSASTDFFRRIGFSQLQRKENFIEGVRIYADYFGFIPAVGFQKRKAIQQLSQAGMDSGELSYAIKVSSLLPWTETTNKIFGSWAHFLEEAGLLANRQRGKGGHQSIATDGHLCLSMGERTICEFLHKNGIDHSREPLYPYDQDLNPNNLLRGDFLVGELIIEFAGMMSNTEYASRMRNKEKLAKKCGIPWLKLETAKLDELREIIFLIEAKQRSK